jgi:hypothetical protein
LKKSEQPGVAVLLLVRPGDVLVEVSYGAFSSLQYLQHAAGGAR